MTNHSAQAPLKLASWENIRFVLQLARCGHLRDVPMWLESRSHPNYLMTKPLPWLSLPAIRWLNNYLRQLTNPKVFEYGSGGSTLYWNLKGCDCVSIEHNELWYREMNARIHACSDVVVRLVKPDIVQGRQPGDADYCPADPLRYQSSDPQFRHCSFENYVRQIDSFPDEGFNLILIDGRARTSCLLHSVKKVRPGGAIILDNADRKHYLERTLPMLKMFTHMQFIGALPTMPTLNRTDVFIKHD